MHVLPFIVVECLLIDRSIKLIKLFFRSISRLFKIHMFIHLPLLSKAGVHDSDAQWCPWSPMENCMAHEIHWPVTHGEPWAHGGPGDLSECRFFIGTHYGVILSFSHNRFMN